MELFFEILLALVCVAVAVQPFEPQVLLGLDDRQLAAPGLSRPKIRALQAIAGIAPIEKDPMEITDLN